MENTSLFMERKRNIDQSEYEENLDTGTSKPLKKILHKKSLSEDYFSWDYVVLIPGCLSYKPNNIIHNADYHILKSMLKVFYMVMVKF